MSRKTLGILGGLGPMATVYFYKMITELTPAEHDGDHIDMIISSKASTPDRTAFITGSGKSPLPVMTSEARKLQSCGADIIVIPCNTAHYFYDNISAQVSVPIINMIYENVKRQHERGVRTLGLMATEGTVGARLYQNMCENFGIRCVVPSPDGQREVTSIIYDYVKRGRRADTAMVCRVGEELRSAGCEAVILGCTELSVVKKDEKLPPFYVDSLQVLAEKAISECL